MKTIEIIRKPIELKEHDFIHLKDTYVYEAKITVTDVSSRLAISLLNYEDNKWTFAIYGVRGSLTTISEGGIYKSKVEAIEKVNSIIAELFNVLSAEHVN